MNNKKLITGISIVLLILLTTQFSLIGSADDTVFVRDLDRDRDRYQDGSCEDPKENNCNDTCIPTTENSISIPQDDGDQTKDRDRDRDQFCDGSCNENCDVTCYFDQDKIRERLRLQDGSCVI